MFKRFSLLLCFVLVLGIMTACGPEEVEDASEDGQESEETEVRSDVVVVGGGGAGLAAAVSAAEEGADVVLLEQMPALGGNTIVAGGAYNAVDADRKAEQGIEDSVEYHFEQTYQGGDEVGQEELIQILVENALDAKHWLESYGMEFEDEIGSVIGSMHERTHDPVKKAGTGYISTMEEAAKDLGVDIELNTVGEELIYEDGEVMGVIASSDDTEKKFVAEEGVILATGGFAANVEMRQEYDPDLDETIPDTNQPGADGSGILMAEELGAATVGMEHIQMLPLSPGKAGPTINVQNVIFVNGEGERFVNENNRRDVLSEAIFDQDDGKYYMINDDQIVEETNQLGTSIDELIEDGTVMKADTLEELADKIDVSADNLIENVEDFNQAVESGEEDEFGRTMFSNKIEEGPYYATERFPAAHHTMGGLEIDTEARVLSEDGEAIPGLYAAGEVTGGIHGTNRLGGNALPDIFVFGRIAGETAVE